VVTLQSLNGNDQMVRRYELSPERLRSGTVPKQQSRLLEHDIGYLRIKSMSNSNIRKITGLLDEFLDTSGLVIDVRDNSGGRYGILQAIYGYFITDDTKPYVSNIAAYRRSVRFDEDHLSYRPTYRMDHPGWSTEQYQTIKTTIEHFKPQWPLPEGLFSDWHFMLLGKQPHNEGKYYSNPVVVLSNSGSFSATDGFLSAFADLDQVTIVGTPSAGGSGATQRFELPRSGIRIALSSMASFRPNGRLYDGNGIEVDVFIQPTITDYLGETDTVLDKAISLLLAD
jgi:C-terminal processing protease CtpA/Prc